MNRSRIIHAPINSRGHAVTAPITQYDYGYRLLPEGIELPATYEIDFSNDEHKGTSLPVYGGAEGAEVPEELIRTGKDVYAFYYFVGDGFGKTEFTWRLPNKCRPSRDGQTPTPTQQNSIDQLIVRSNDAVTSAEQSASAAGQSARSAQGYAEQAETAKTNAQTYANNAQTSATQASASASQASTSASTASAAATSASASAASAYADAERAEQAASTAGYLDVEIVDGRLIYTRTDAVDVDFTLNNGRLIMEAI